MNMMIWTPPNPVGRLLPVAMALLLGCAPWSVSASAEDELARREAAKKTLQQVQALQGDRLRGESLYATCAACHGVTGMGQPDGNAPVIANQHLSVLLKQLVDYRYALRWDLSMEHVVELKQFTQLQDLADVASFISTLPHTGWVGQGTGESLREGAWTFVLRCASCHGASGAGSAPLAVPVLAGQHYEYLLRQFLDIAEGRRPQLSATHGVHLHELAKSDIESMADYLSRITPPSVVTAVAVGLRSSTR